METWAWLAAYLLGFALLGVYLYMYFVGKRSTAESSATESTPEPGSPGIADPSSAVDPPEDARTDELVACETCGTYNRNDRMFLYCKDCGERLH